MLILVLKKSNFEQSEVGGNKKKNQTFAKILILSYYLPFVPVLHIIIVIYFLSLTAFTICLVLVDEHLHCKPDFPALISLS